MWGWFGGNSAQQRKDAPKKAILQLRMQLDMLQKREKHLENQMAEQDAIARKNVSTNKTGTSDAPHDLLIRLPIIVGSGCSAAQTITSNIRVAHVLIRHGSCPNGLEAEEGTRALAGANREPDHHAREPNIFDRVCEHQPGNVDGDEERR